MKIFSSFFILITLYNLSLFAQLNEKKMGPKRYTKDVARNKYDFENSVVLATLTVPLDAGKRKSGGADGSRGRTEKTSGSSDIFDGLNPASIQGVNQAAFYATNLAKGKAVTLNKNKLGPGNDKSQTMNVYSNVFIYGNGEYPYESFYVLVITDLQDVKQGWSLYWGDSQNDNWSYYDNPGYAVVTDVTYGNSSSKVRAFSPLPLTHTEGDRKDYYTLDVNDLNIKGASPSEFNIPELDCNEGSNLINFTPHYKLDLGSEFNNSNNYSLSSFDILSSLDSSYFGPGQSSVYFANNFGCYSLCFGNGVDAYSNNKAVNMEIIQAFKIQAKDLDEKDLKIRIQIIGYLSTWRLTEAIDNCEGLSPDGSDVCSQLHNNIDSILIEKTFKNLPKLLEDQTGRPSVEKCYSPFSS